MGCERRCGRRNEQWCRWCPSLASKVGKCPGVGQPFAGNFTGTDIDGDNLTLGHLGLPPGATLAPPSGTTAPQPFASTFSWTPQAVDAGSARAVTIVYTDSGGLQDTCSFSIRVPLCGDGIIDPASGEQCDPGPVPNGCGAGDACTPSCDCVPCGNGVIDAGEQCDDGNTVNGDCCDASCMFETGSCDDGDICTSGESCQAGACTGGSSPDCSGSGDACNVASCDPNGTAVNCDLLTSVVDGSPCDDGVFCTDADICVAGACVAGPARSCDDGDSCTTDTCDEGGQSCDNTPDPAQDGLPCDDGNPCSGDGVCTTGLCSAGAINVESRACNTCGDGVDGAVFGKRVRIGSLATVVHAPFTGLLPLAP